MHCICIGNYGFSGIEAFKNEAFNIVARKAMICEATAEKISNNADDEAFDKVG